MYQNFPPNSPQQPQNQSPMPYQNPPQTPVQSFPRPFPFPNPNMTPSQFPLTPNDPKIQEQFAQYAQVPFFSFFFSH